MTTPAGDARRRSVRLSLILAIAAVIIVLLALFTPEAESGRSGDDRLSSLSTGPLGAQGLYELAERLGWRVARRYDDTTLAGDSGVVQLVLAPPVSPSAIETHEMLERVRRGGALLYVMPDGGGDALDDSLRVRHGDAGVLAPAAEAATCPPRERGFSELASSLWPDSRVHLWTLRWRKNARPALTVFASVDHVVVTEITRSPRTFDTSSVAAAGFTYGRGRVVVVADPDLLRNDVLRICHWGAAVIAVRMLEYLSGRDEPPPHRDQLVFDEYHQGRGVHPGTFRGIALYLSRAASGHMLLQLGAAGLLVLLAVGPRALPPRDSERIERRSPIEHVEALARAYLQVGATKTATARLLHGVRRRVEHAAGGGSRSASDEAFLDWAARRASDRGEDIALIRRALTTSLKARDLEAVGSALRRVELSLTNMGVRS